MMDNVVLTTDRLELRQIGEGDLDAHMEHLNTPAVMARLGGPRPREVIVEKHAQSRESFAREGFGFMLVYERATGELVGHCGMKRVSNPLAHNIGDHEIGWLVREDRWRMGYAKEAMCAVIDWAFEQHGAPHVVALTSESNVGSWKLMEKLGMVRCEDLDFDDPFFSAEDNPTIIYRLTPEQWAEAKGEL